tara:strand:+ start:123 stop:1058 length:936 start_codon:yes stop_codon:yes gene_type:complete
MAEKTKLEQLKLKLNPYKDRTTQEGEFGFFSPGTDRGWKLVKDHKDPRKRVWHLVDNKTGTVLDKKTGALTIGGNLSEWAHGGIKNTANWFANLSIENQIKHQEMLDKGYTPVQYGRSSIKWVKTQPDPEIKPKTELKSVETISEENNFDQSNQRVDTNVSVDGQPSELEVVPLSINNNNTAPVVPLSIKNLNAPGTKQLTSGTAVESTKGVSTKTPYWRNEANRPKVWARKWAGGDGTTLKEANTKTINWLKSEGYDVSAIPKHKLKDLLANVRLERTHFTRGTKGDFLHHDGHIIKRKPKPSNKNNTKK